MHTGRRLSDEEISAIASECEREGYCPVWLVQFLPDRDPIHHDWDSCSYACNADEAIAELQRQGLT